MGSGVFKARCPFYLKRPAPLFNGMNEKERQVLEAQLYSIDRHRAELELVAGTLPPHDFMREAIEREIAGLWQRRLEIAERLNRPAA
jgi:hypothetical protein